MSFRSSRTLVLGTTMLVLVPLTTYAVFVKHTIDSGHPVAMASPPISSVEPAVTPSPVEGEKTKPAKDSVQVAIDNFAFSPAELTIAAGTKVTWTNRDDVPHTATSIAKPRTFDSGVLDTDQQFSYVFTTPGKYDYFCAVHPHMTAQIVVKYLPIQKE